MLDAFGPFCYRSFLLQLHNVRFRASSAMENLHEFVDKAKRIDPSIIGFLLKEIHSKIKYIVRVIYS